MTSTPHDTTSADGPVAPIVAIPEAGQPGSGQSGSGQPGAGQSGVGRSGVGRAPLPVAALVAAAWAAITGYGPLVVLAAIGAAGSAGWPAGAARLAAMGWLLGQGVPLETASDRISLTPLAIAGLAAWRLAKAGVQASRVVGGHLVRSPIRALVASGAVAIGYGGLGALAAYLASTPGLAAAPGRAGLTLAGFAFAAAGLGAVSHGRAGRLRRRRIPIVIRDAARTGLTAAMLIAGAGAVAVGAALAIRGDDATDVLGSYRAGIVGQAGITVLSLAYLPNLAMWGATYLLGPGFSLGVDTLVSPGLVILGPLPALPALAAVPSAPASGAIASILLGAPVAAAICAGWLLGTGRSARIGDRTVASNGAGPGAGLVTGQVSGGGPGLGGLPVSGAGPVPGERLGSGLGRQLWVAVLAGPLAGIALQGVGWLSAGAVGSGRMAILGPTSWRVFLLATLVVSFGSAAGVVAARFMAALRR